MYLRVRQFKINLNCKENHNDLLYYLFIKYSSLVQLKALMNVFFSFARLEVKYCCQMYVHSFSPPYFTPLQYTMDLRSFGILQTKYSFSSIFHSTKYTWVDGIKSCYSWIKSKAVVRLAPLLIPKCFYF